MDFTGKTPTEIKALIEEATSAYVAAEMAERAQKEQLRADLAAVIESFTALLGPVDAQPGDGSIRAVRAFDAVDLAAGNPRGTTMVANAPLALSKLYEGLEITAVTALKLARLAGEG